MSHDDEIFLAVVGPESAMKDIEKISIAGVEIDPPQPMDAMVDAVDAPLGPDQIQLILMHATVVLKFGVAAAQFGLVTAQFAGELKKLLTQTEAHEKPRIVIVDAKTSAPVMEITEDTDAEKAGEAIKNATRT
ncbi:hypothetical protein [Mesorhizobium carmichaelinearum]|uniref:hypothetical protein n=1 Tax=Mesorhizobium carmichaelinearum TaxID=1208188 RepID=UPI000BA41129|nr:hypothetical protein [Mesorhizobium carmichaelinearum]